MIFAVFDVLLAVNMCINYSFFTFILIRDVQNSNFIFVQILKKTPIRFGMSLVRFGMKNSYLVWIL